MFYLTTLSVASYEYIASNDWTTQSIGDESETLQNEAVLTYTEALLRHFPGGTEE